MTARDEAVAALAAHGEFDWPEEVLDILQTPTVRAALLGVLLPVEELAAAIDEVAADVDRRNGTKVDRRSAAAILARLTGSKP